MAARSKRVPPTKQVENVLSCLEETILAFNAEKSQTEEQGKLLRETTVDKAEAFLSWKEERGKNLAAKMSEVQARLSHLEEKEAEEKAKLAKAVKAHSRKEKEILRTTTRMENLEASVSDMDKVLQNQKSELDRANQELIKAQSWYSGPNNPDNLSFPDFVRKQSLLKEFYEGTTGVFFGKNPPELSQSVSADDSTCTSIDPLSSSLLVGIVVTTNPNVRQKVRNFEFCTGII